jgi:carbon storage regulator
MLVLSRHRDETIMIGDDVEITVVDIRGDKVRLGINAPTRIAVHRKEVYEAIRAENMRAAALEDVSLERIGSKGSGPAPGAVVKSSLLSSPTRGGQPAPEEACSGRRTA